MAEDGSVAQDAYLIPYRTHGFRSSEAFPHRATAAYPIVDLTLRCNGRQVHCASVIDSGTHFSLFPFSLGEALGLEVEKGKKAVVPPEEVVYFWPLEVALEEKLVFPVYGGFSVHQDKRKVGLLGQIGFFDKFDVRFEMQKGRIMLIPQSEEVRPCLPP